MCDGAKGFLKGVYGIPDYPSVPRPRKPPVIDVEEERRLAEERARLVKSRSKAGFGFSDTVINAGGLGAAPAGKATLLGT